MLGRLGAGGMGVVYKARDPDLARDVAIKVLPPERMLTEEIRARFLREARAAAAVHHPNIATIFEVGQHEGVVYLVMELVGGESLGERMRLGPMAVGETLRIAKQIADALAHAHEAGIVHRDIKPENVMIDRGDRVKILDFGIAKSFGAPTASDHDATVEDLYATGDGRIIGTPAYMSPEQARGKRVDHRSDLFSLGIVLYEMLCAALPFEGEGALLLLAAIAQDPPTPLAEHRADIPRALVEVIDRLLEKAPEDRFRSAAELLQALDAVEAQRSAEIQGAVTLEARAVDGAELDAARAAPRRGTSPTLRWVGVAAALLALIVGGLAWWSASDRGVETRVDPSGELPGVDPAPLDLHETRLTANPAELWITVALPVDQGRGMVYQDESGVFRVSSFGREPEQISIPARVTGVPRHVFREGLLFGANGDDPEALLFVHGDEVRELGVDAITATVSADDRQIAYTNRRGLYVADLDAEARISRSRRVASIAEGESVEQFLFSPSGRRLALIRVSRRADDTLGTLEVIDIEDGRTSLALSGTQLLQTGGMAGLGWRDEERLLCALSGDPARPPESALYEIRLEGIVPVGEPRRLHVFEGAAGVTDLRMSEAGLFFLKLLAQADVQVAAIDADGSLGPSTRLTSSEQNDRPGAIAADGRVVFTSDRLGSWDLFARSQSSLRAERLTSGSAQDTYPRVAPDGSLVFFRLEVAEGGAIEAAHVMRREDAETEPRALFEVEVEGRLRSGGRPPPEAARLRCARASCFVSTIVGERMRVERFDPASGAREPFLDLDAPEGLYDWDISRDEQTLALVHGTNELIFVPVASPGERRVIRVAPTGAMASVAFAPGGDWGAATGVHVEDDRYVILRVGLDGEVRVLLRSTHTYFAHPCFSPDGRTLAYGQQNYDLDVWRLDGFER